MSAVLISLGSALLVLLTVFVIALLRSHADILRRLHAVEERLRGAPAPAPLEARGGAASDIAGQTLAGDAAQLSLGPGSPATLLAFLSSGCAACVPLWDELRAGAQAPTGVRLVLVAKSAQEESVARLRELAPAGAQVLLSTQAWAEYSVQGSPHFVLVDGASGRVAGRGAAGSWQQIASMVAQAIADARTDAAQPGSGGGASNGTGARAVRAEQALASAGIGEGHPSLYASLPPDGAGG
jgi:hypothetical protein